MLVLTTNLALKNNNTANFVDTTGDTAPNSYGKDSNINFSSVKAIRIYMGNYTTLNASSSPQAGVFTKYVQYIKIGGSPETINNKTFVAGSVFVPQFDNLSTLQPDNWQTTGYYNYPFLDTWLPTSSQAPLNIVTSQFGQSGTNIQDNIYLYGYEIYDNLQTSSFSAVQDATYMVLDGNAVYNGDTFYAGEVFTAIDTHTITVSSKVVQLYATTSAYASLIYFIISQINDLIEKTIGKNNQDLVQQTQQYILKIRTRTEALTYSCNTNNVSLYYAYQTILDLTARLAQLLNPGNILNP